MKTKKILFKLLLILFAFAVITYSCDKIEGPFTELQPKDTTVVLTYIRKVLVEDYTGHTCGNCPAAAISLDSIISQNNGKVVSMVIHAGFFAEVKTTGMFTYNFTNSDGIALDAFFGNSVAGNPNGMVNRIEYKELKHIKSHTAWSSLVANELAKPAVANIELKVEYNASNRTATIKTTNLFLSELIGNYKLCLFVTEDSIVKAQKDYSKPSPSNIAKYTHKHVMRKAVNSTWGEIVATGTIKKNDKILKDYSVVLNNEWNEKKCNLVAFIYNTDSYEVIQAEEAHIISR